MRSRTSGEIGRPNSRLSIDSAGTRSVGTDTSFQARGVPSVSVITIGKSMLPTTSARIGWSWALREPGTENSARKRVSTCEVVEISRESRAIICWVNRNTPPASNTPPRTSSGR
jgi:hypothetical protein